MSESLLFSRRILSKNRAGLCHMVADGYHIIEVHPDINKIFHISAFVAGNIYTGLSPLAPA